MLRATTACNFSSLISPDVSAPAALASLLFNPPEPQNHEKTWKNTVFRDFPTFSRTCIFFLLIFSVLTLLPADCFFISPYCRKFDFQTSLDNVFLLCFNMQCASFCSDLTWQFSSWFNSACTTLQFLSWSYWNDWQHFEKDEPLCPSELEGQQRQHSLYWRMFRWRFLRTDSQELLACGS